MEVIAVIFTGIVMIICATALLRFVVARSTRGRVDDEVVERLEQRMQEVERRLTDIQDIVLSIDEKLELPRKADLT